MASTYLYRTNTSATNTYTFSAWVKLANPTGNDNQWIFMNNDSGLMIRGGSAGASGEQFHFYNNSNTTNYYSGAKRRDVSGWYHIVLSSNSGTGTLYVNGETDKTGIVVPNLGTATNGFVIGKHSGANTQYFDGLMSHIHFIDGTAYDASAFGETDTTTGEWKGKTSPSVTYGTNGFFILKDGNGITDQSSNSNDFTLGGGTLTNLKDNPDNVFATFNPLIITSAGGVAVRTPGFQDGNTTALFDDNGNNEFALSTLAPSKGKYYAEFKWVNATGSGSSTVGIVKANFAIQTDVNDQGIVYKGDGNKVVNNSSSSYGASWTTGDIIGIALDCDSNTVNFYKNSVAQGSISIDADTNWYMYCSSYALSSVTRSVNANFGNGYFGTTAVSSAGTNASDNGIFEYDVPTGYTALSTKGLNL